jgi:multidrug resistance efflux pump
MKPRSSRRTAISPKLRPTGQRAQEFRPHEELKKGGVASESDYDQATGAVGPGGGRRSRPRGGAASVARLNLERSQVKAPFDGRSRGA